MQNKKHLMRWNYLDLLKVTLSLLAWVASFNLNIWVFSNFEWAQGINWIFLPAAVRLIAVLIFGSFGALGIALGALLTSDFVYGQNIIESLIGATLTALGSLLAVWLWEKWLRMSVDLHEMTAANLLLLAVLTALCNVVPHNVFFWFSSIESNPFLGVIPMFIGDMIGILIVFYTLRSLILISDGLRNSTSS